MSHLMRCIRCDRELADSCPSDEPGVTGGPLGGTFWRSRGNYGSEIIDDPLASGPSLEAYVCDPCLRERAAVVYTVTSGPLPRDDVYELGIKL